MRKVHYFHDQKTEKILDFILKKEKESKNILQENQKKWKKLRTSTQNLEHNVQINIVYLLMRTTYLGD